MRSYLLQKLEPNAARSHCDPESVAVRGMICWKIDKTKYLRRFFFALEEELLEKPKFEIPR